MAISATIGAAASTTAAAASKALGAFTLTVGQDVYVFVGLDSTATAVTSITDTAGNTYTFVGAKDGTGVRIECWKSVGVAAQVANVITVNVSPNSNIAPAAEEYAGVSAAGNTASDAVASDRNPVLGNDAQDGNNFVAFGIAFPCQSGDTLAALLGTERQKSIPAATAVGVALYDVTSVSNATLRALARISAARGWAAFALELRSGGGDNLPDGYPVGDAPALNGDKDTKYLNVKWPLGGGESSGGGGAWPFVA